MKILSLLGLLGSFSYAHSLEMREYNVNFTVSNGEQKSIQLQIDPVLDVDIFGEPNIEAHGHYDYNVTGRIVENGTTCTMKALLAQGRGEKLSTEKILRARYDRPAQITLCSGLILSLTSVRSLLTDVPLMVGLRAHGLQNNIGSGTLVFNPAGEDL